MTLARQTAKFMLPLVCYIGLLAAAWELRVVVGYGLLGFVPVVAWTATRISAARRKRRALRTTGRPLRTAQLSTAWLLMFVVPYTAGCVLFMATPWPLGVRAAVFALAVLVSAAAALLGIRCEAAQHRQHESDAAAPTTTAAGL